MLFMLSEMSVGMRHLFLFSPYSIPLFTSLCMLVDLDDTRSGLKWTGLGHPEVRLL